ncbi:MAG TPA: hypothetical protein VMV50_00920 [Candidatus Paceibacterota bacterium]|nr:hypothetical protein [Candidatus Paceibacterota bacterium]
MVDNPDRRFPTIIIVVVILAALAGLYAWTARAPTVASIAVTSPAGGETWQPGETHTIAWTTRGIPATDKISVTIRRIPPPPPQTEGQEFDPIVFTNLPNTGSTTWTISPMYPGGTYVLGVSAYESVPVTNPVSAESAEFTITHPKLAIGLYPLYTAVSWNASEVESFLIGTTTYSGVSMTSAPVTDTMNPGSVFTPFMDYYDRLLKSHGWHVANDLAAGGHVGGQTGYRNGPGTILVGFHIDYKTTPANAPSECPCDVTLSLFSTSGD